LPFTPPTIFNLYLGDATPKVHFWMSGVSSSQALFVFFNSKILTKT
jgi:hypothetical protein